MSIKSIFGIVFLLVMFMSCQNSGTKWLPSVSGAQSEVILVLEEELWADSTGSIFRHILAFDYPSLPQLEPAFNLVQIPPKAFKNLFLEQRNILRVKLSPDITESSIKVQEDVWAQPQIYITISAPTVSELNELLLENAQKLYTYIETAEQERLLVTYEKYKNKDLMEHLRQKHNLEIIVPEGFLRSIDKENFVWLSRPIREIEQGILIYYYPYQDTSMFGKESLIKTRDSILKKYVTIQSSQPAYAITEQSYADVEREDLLFRNKYAVLLRGLWRAEPRYIGMGGPFISLSTIDESLNRIITIEGFVYAPDDRKRNHIKQLETILYSLKYGEELMP